MRIKNHMKFLISQTFSIILIIGFFLITYGDVYAEEGIENDSPDEIEGVIVFIEIDGDIYLIDGKIDQRIQLTNDANLYKYLSPKFSPNGRYLTFLRSDPEKGESYYDLFLMDLSDKSIKRIVNNIDNWGGYNWAPDSNSIIYGHPLYVACNSPEQKSTLGIWEFQIKSGESKELVSPSSPNAPLMDPVYSFDGTWLKFASYPCFSEGRNNHTINLKTGEKFSFDGSIDWEPNQNKLGWCEWGGNDLLEIDPNMNQNRVLFQAENMTCQNLHWSPDGKWISMRLSTITENIYFIEGEYSDWVDQLVIAKSDGSQHRIICTSNEINACPFVTWSPTGDQIIYQKMEQDNYEWILYDLRTQNLTTLPDFGTGGMDWTISIPREDNTVKDDISSGISKNEDDSLDNSSKNKVIFSQGTTPYITIGGFLIVMSAIIFIILHTPEQGAQ